MYQPASGKTIQMLEKRKKFESQPLFIKAGFYNERKYNSVRQQGFCQRLVATELLKLKGNKEFSELNYEKAARIYEEALSIFRFVSSLNPRWKNEGILDENLVYFDYEGETSEEIETSRNLKLSLYLNLAICYLRLQDYRNSKASSEEVLKLDANNTKALYRRAKALTSDPIATSVEFKSAIEDLTKASAIEPDNSDIHKELSSANTKLVKMIAEEEKAKKLASIAAEKKKMQAEVSNELNYQATQGSDDSHSPLSTKADSPRLKCSKESNQAGTINQNLFPEAVKTGNLLTKANHPELEISFQTKQIEEFNKRKEYVEFKLNELGLEELQKRLDRLLTLKKHLESLASVTDAKSLNYYQKELALNLEINLKNPDFREEYQKAENEVVGSIHLLAERISALQNPSSMEEHRAKHNLKKKIINEALKNDSNIDESLVLKKSSKKELPGFPSSKVFAKINQSTSLVQVFSEAIKEATRYQAAKSKYFDSRDYNLILIIILIVIFGTTIYLQLYGRDDPKKIKPQFKP